MNERTTPPPGVLAGPVFDPSCSSGHGHADDGRVAAAERLLQEAVYASRAKQAGAAGLAGADLAGSAGPGNCGLGHRALVELERTDSGRAAFGALFSEEPAGQEAAALERILTRWVERQDALDRKRNHFLRDFREQHGYDRRQYEAAVRAAFEAGLDAVNAEEAAGRRQAALELAALASR